MDLDLDFARRVFRGDEGLCSLVGRVGWGLLVCMLYGVVGLPGWYCSSVGCRVRGENLSMLNGWMNVWTLFLKGLRLL